MTFADVLAHYKTQSAAARALGIAQASVAEWAKAGVPILRQYQIEVLSKGSLKVSTSVDKSAPASKIDGAGRESVGAATSAGDRPAPKGQAVGVDHGGAGKPRAGRAVVADTSPRSVALATAQDAGIRSGLTSTNSAPSGEALAKASKQAKAGAQGVVSLPGAMAQPGGAQARMAMLDAGPTASHDATNPTAPQAKVISAVPAWHKSEQGILTRAKALGLPLVRGETWRQLIERCEQAKGDAPLP